MDAVTTASSAPSAPAAAATLPSASGASGAHPQPAVKKLSISAPPRDDREADKRPLDLGLILRLLAYTRPYAAKRNWLLVMCALRAIQLPLVAWTIGAVIAGPIQGRAPLPSILAGAFGLLVLAASTQAGAAA